MATRAGRKTGARAAKSPTSVGPKDKATRATPKRSGGPKKKTRKAAARKRASARSPRHHHHVYVIELQRAVWMEPGFRRANPDGDITRPAVYVGMTGLKPDVRFDKHMAGIQAGRYVQAYGLRLLPELYEAYNPMPYEAAREMEVELAIALREQGYGVWQA